MVSPLNASAAISTTLLTPYLDFALAVAAFIFERVKIMQIILWQVSQLAVQRWLPFKICIQRGIHVKDIEISNKMESAF